MLTHAIDDLRLAEYESDGDQYMPGYGPASERGSKAIPEPDSAPQSEAGENLFIKYGFDKKAALDTGGGHGMLTSGDKLFKATHQSEIDAYEQFNSDEKYQDIRRWIPPYFGAHIDDNAGLLGRDPSERTGQIEDPEDGIKPITKTNTSDGHRQGIIIGNSLAGYVPGTETCFDLKLGRKMWDSTADAAKRARMDAQVDNSTSREHSVRLVWGQTSVFDSKTGTSVIVRNDKQYGYGLKRSEKDDRKGVETLNDAFARYYLLPGDRPVPKLDGQPAEPPRYTTTVEEDEEDGGAADGDETQPSVTGADPSKAVRAKRLKRLLRHRGAIDETRGVLTDHISDLHELKADVMRTPFMLTGASILVHHGVPKGTERDHGGVEWDTHDGRAGGRMTLSDGSVSGTDVTIRSSSPSVVSAALDMDGGDYPRKAPKARRRVGGITLIDLARGSVIEDPDGYDKDFVDGLDTTISLGETRLREINSANERLSKDIDRVESDLFSLTQSPSGTDLDPLDMELGGTTKNFDVDLVTRSMSDVHSTGKFGTPQRSPVDSPSISRVPSQQSMLSYLAGTMGGRISPILSADPWSRPSLPEGPSGQSENPWGRSAYGME